MIEFRCPGSCRCGTHCFVEDRFAGCTISCPSSGVPIQVPLRTFSETEWLTGTDPQELLYGLPDRICPRKFRLIALACCQRMSHRLTHELSQEAVVMAEQNAEGMVSDDELRNLSQRFRFEYNQRLAASGRNWNSMNTSDLDAAYEMTFKIFPASVVSRVVEAAKNQTEERAVLCGLIRCVVGNPYAPAPVYPPRVSSTVNALAQAIYNDRAFQRMGVLADALEDAGCTDTDILNHCQGPGPHFRGCWVLDLLLAKA
jgi:hypothetical protein